MGAKRSPRREVQEEHEEGHERDAQGEGEADSLDPVDLRLLREDASREQRRHEHVPGHEEHEEDRQEVALAEGEQDRGYDDRVAHGDIQVSGSLENAAASRTSRPVQASRSFNGFPRGSVSSFHAPVGL